MLTEPQAVKVLPKESVSPGPTWCHSASRADSADRGEMKSLETFAWRHSHPSPGPQPPQPCLSLHPSMCPSASPFDRSPLCLYASPSACLCQLVCQQVCLSLPPSARISMHLSVRQCLCLPVSKSVHLPPIKNLSLSLSLSGGYLRSATGFKSSADTEIMVIDSHTN